MSYYSKYLKYKNKYLVLKGGSQNLEILRKRIPTEINLLNVLNVKNINFNEEENILKLEDNTNKFKFKLDKYPFIKPIFYKNNTIINVNVLIEWSASKTLKDILEKYYEREASEFKILIFCHPRIVSGSINNIEGHFLGGDISFLGKEAGITETGSLTIDTVDILPGGIYQADAFSDEFINENLYKYNLVFIPDCGGIWYELQTKFTENTPEVKNNNLSLIIDYIIKVLNLVKINGIITFGKILFREPCKIRDIDFNNFIEAIMYFLKENNFISYCKSSLIYSGYELIIGKRML